MNLLLDTNVLSEVRRPAPDPKVLAWLDAIDEDRAFISVASIAELRRGIALMDDGRRREVLTAWLAEDLPARFDSGLGVTRNRTLAIDPKRFSTSLEGVFAAGDIVRGASLVVWAIRDGQDAAESIHQWISARAEAPLSVAAE